MKKLTSAFTYLFSAVLHKTGGISANNKKSPEKHSASTTLTFLHKDFAIWDKYRENTYILRRA